MGKNFKSIQDETNDNTAHNVRQLGSAAQSGTHQSQILSALDVLGAKLVRSETERETMRKLLNEALDAQEKLESQLERSHIDIQRRMDLMERKEAGLSDADRQLIEGQKEELASTRKLLDGQQSNQQKIEDQLRDSVQTIAKLQRRLDSQEQKRMKLQRRVERVENMAADAQNALEAKAMVLLTDQSESVRNLPHYEAQSAMQALDALHDSVDVKDAKTTGIVARLLRGSSTSVLTVLLAVGIGWGMATTLRPSDDAFMIMNDGQLARINLKEGVATPISYNADNSVSTVSVTGADIEGDIALMATDWLTQDVLDQALSDIEMRGVDVTPVETASDVAVEAPSIENGEHAPSVFDVLQTVPTGELTMDRDLSLPDDMKQLEDKAFAHVPEAQHDLAALYTAGQAGVKQNYERAAFWFRQAADRGIANAAYNLGVLYQQGLGQQQDLQKALDWYRRAAQLGHPEAQYNLGIAYIEGVGTRYNPNMAAAFFQKAALSGIVEAAYNLGLILENGLLGEVRPNDALKWYRAAAESGSLEAAEALRNLSQRMDIPEDRAGLLDNGESLLAYIRKMQGTDPVEKDSVETVIQDSAVSLGALIPTGEQIRIAQIQEQLRKNRLYNGPQDGIVGAGTVKAIKSYQRQQGLEADGEPTISLLTYMLQQGTK